MSYEIIIDWRFSKINEWLLFRVIKFTIHRRFFLSQTQGRSDGVKGACVILLGAPSFIISNNANIYVFTKGMIFSKYMPIENLFIFGYRGPLAFEGSFTLHTLHTLSNEPACAWRCFLITLYYIWLQESLVYSIKVIVIDASISLYIISDFTTTQESFAYFI